MHYTFDLWCRDVRIDALRTTYSLAKLFPISSRWFKQALHDDDPLPPLHTATGVSTNTTRAATQTARRKEIENEVRSETLLKWRTNKPARVDSRDESSTRDIWYDYTL
jgi:hypothetical protein